MFYLLKNKQKTIKIYYKMYFGFRDFFVAYFVFFGIVSFTNPYKTYHILFAFLRFRYYLDK